MSTIQGRTAGRLAGRALALWMIGIVGLPVGRAAPQAEVATWVEVRQIGSFLCHGQFPLEEVPGIVETFGRLERDLVQALGIEPRPMAVEVYLFATERQYREYLAAYLPDVPYRRALFVRRQGRTWVLAYKSSELLVDLRHESVHAVLHGWLAYVPLWLDEGLAEYFEQPPGRRAFEHPHLKSVRFQAFLGRNTKLEDLEAITDMAVLGEKEYRASWAWVHYLIHGPTEVNDEFRAYLRDIQQGVPVGPLAERLRTRVPELDKSFRAHFRSWHP